MPTTTPDVQLDTVKDADLEVTQDGARYIRTGRVNNIDVADTPDPDALVKVLDLLPKIGTTLGVRSQNLKLARIRVVPDEAMFRRVRLFLTYETNTVNYTPTIYMLRDRTYSVPTSDMMIPGLNQAAMVSYQVSDGGSPPTVRTLIKAQPVIFNYDMSARSIQLTVLMYGRPDGGGGEKVNHVNDAAWPTGDAGFNQFEFDLRTGTRQVKTAGQLPKGYWRLAQYQTDYDRQKGMTLVQSEAVTKVISDWSQKGLMQDSNTGTFPFGSLTDAERAAVYAAASAPAYSHGIIYPTGNTVQKGYIRVGHYPLTSFSTLFGF